MNKNKTFYTINIWIKIPNSGDFDYRIKITKELYRSHDNASARAYELAVQKANNFDIPEDSIEATKHGGYIVHINDDEHFCFYTEKLTLKD